MKLIDFFISHPVTTATLFLTVIILGIISLTQLNVNLLPDLAYPRLAVIVEYPGVSAIEIETLVTAHLEAAIGSISGVKKVYSSSREGIALITVEFYWSTQMDLALLHLKEKVEDARRFLPIDCPPPAVVDIDPAARPIMLIALFDRRQNSELPMLRESAEMLFKPRLEQIKGVARVEISGGGERELLITIDPAKLNLFNIDLNTVKAILQEWNQQGAGGVILKSRERFILKIVSEITDLHEFEAIPVKFYPERTIFLRDIASIHLENKLEQSISTFNGKRCLSLAVYREASGNTVRVSREIERTLKAMQKEFPEFELVVVRRDSDLIEASINNLKSSLLQGAVLALLILFLFFQNWRDPLLVVSITPVAICATFFLMYLTGVQLNIMSLGGLALGVGMFIDNGIIVVENLFRTHRLISDRRRAVVEGAYQMLPALIGSNLTTMVIFLPVIYIYGISGRLFRDQALTINLALLVALLVSFTLLPALFRQFSERQLSVEKSFPDEKKKGIWSTLHRLLSLPFKIIGFILGGLIELILLALKAIRNFFTLLLKLITPLLKHFNQGYEHFSKFVLRLEEYCLEKKRSALLIALILLSGVIIFFLIIKKELLPSTSTPRFEIEAFTQDRLDIEESLQLGQLISRHLRQFPEVKNLFAQLGYDSANRFQSEKASVNYLYFLVEVRQQKQKQDLIEKCRQYLQKIDQLRKYLLHSERTTLSEYLSFGEEGLEVKVFYDSLYAGKKYACIVSDIIRQEKGVGETVSNLDESKEILQLRFKEQNLINCGINKRELLEYLKFVLRGEKSGIFRYYQKNFDLIISSPLRMKAEITDLKNLFFQGKNGNYKLDELIYFEPLTEVTEITRENQKRFFYIHSSLQRMNLANFAANLQKRLTKLNLPQNVSVEISGEEEERVQSFKSIELALLLSVLLVFMTIAATLENLIYPLIIMSCMPMGFFGGLLFLLLSGQSLNIISGIGFLVSSGIVVNDAIVKIDCANRLRRDGLSVREAITTATVLRLRPILLTTLTTIFGVLPMIYMQGSGTELQKPLATVIAGSLSFSTILTLILIPVLYELVTAKKNPFNAAKKEQ